MILVKFVISQLAFFFSANCDFLHGKFYFSTNKLTGGIVKQLQSCDRCFAKFKGKDLSS